jgi:hypothetical protein
MIRKDVQTFRAFLMPGFIITNIDLRRGFAHELRLYTKSLLPLLRRSIVFVEISINR